MLPARKTPIFKKRPVSNLKNSSGNSYKKSKLIFFVLFLALSFGLFSVLYRSKIKDYSRVNFLLKNQNSFFVVSLGSLAKGDKTIVLELPQDKKILLTRGFGEYPLGSIYSLGELEGKGESLLRESLQNFFGLSLDGYFFDKENTSTLKTKSEISRFLEKSLFKKNKSNFSFADRVWLLRRLAVSPESDFSYFDFNAEKFLNSEKQFDLAKTDAFLGKYFIDQKLSEENLALAVYNSADLSGLAGQAARLLINSGGRVVTIANADLREKILIKVDPKAANSYSFRKIKTFFPQADCEEGEVESGRADLAIYLGKDYWKMLWEKW